MALSLETIRSAADRVAASHGLDVVDLEFSGGAKHRMLRVFLEKDVDGRARLAAMAVGEAEGLPSGVPVESLSGVTHEDCASFAQDFGVLVDVEDLVPGAEYTLEVSSPGLERKLTSAREFERFTGSLVKLQTTEPIHGNKHWQGRLRSFANNVLTLDLAAVKQKGKAKKATTETTEETIEIALAQVEKANLVAEI